MRSLPILILALVLLACGDDDDDDAPRAAARSTSTTTTTTIDRCPEDELRVPDAADGTPAEIVASSGDLRLAVVDQGASVEVISVFRLDGCDLRPLQLGGQPVALPVGGTVTHGDGIRCTEDELVVLSATSDDGATYQATAVTYRVEGDELVESDRSASTIEAQEEADTLRTYYELACDAP